jgi:hypothetical protein
VSESAPPQPNPSAAVDTIVGEKKDEVHEAVSGARAMVRIVQPTRDPE